MPLGNPIRKQNESRIVSVLATEGQTVFTVQGGYRINQISVFRNGVRLSNSEDFTAGDGSTVTLNTEANVNDRIEFHIFDRFTVQNAIVSAASTQTISGDVVVNGKIFGNLDVPSINTGILTATNLNFGKGDISGDFKVTGVSTFTGAVTTGGDVTTGGALIVGAGVTIGGAIVPSTDGNINLGSSSKEWQHLFIDGVAFIDNLAADTAAIADLTDNRVVIAGSSGELEDSANLTFDGSTLTVTGDVSIADKIIHTGDTNTAIRFPSADTITAETSGTEAIRINNSGQFLVGVTAARTMLSGYTPSLQVEGTANSDSSVSIVENISAASGPSLWFGKTRGNSLGANTVVQSGDELGTIVFNGADGTDVQSMAAFIRASVDGTPGSNDMPGRITIHTTADGANSPTERLRINSGGQISIRGTNTAFDTTGDLDSLQMYYETDSGQASIGPYSSGGNTYLSLYTNASGNAATEKVRISSDGRMSIGVNPSVIQSLLNVKTDSSDGTQPVVLRLGNNSSGSGTGAAMVMGAGSGASSQGVTLAGFYDGTGTTFTVGTNASFNGSTTERFRIAGSGFVGINQNNPTCQLQIDTGASGDGTVTALELNHKGNDTNDAVKLNFARAGSDIGSIVLEKVASNNTTDFIFNTRASNTVSESMRIIGSGNVGINETAPSEKLQIDGDILLGGQANPATADYAIKFEYNNHQFAKIVGNGRDSTGYGDIDFYTSSGSGVSNMTQRMTIRENGYIGIAEASPINLLTISNASGQNDTNGNLQVRYTGTSGTANSGLTVKNYKGTSQLMQWEGSGVRIGNRIVTNSGAGHVYITTGGDTVRLSISATTGNFSGSASNDISDGRLKENIASISNATAIIKQLLGKTFTWKEEAKLGTDKKYGFIAQEMKTVLPDLVYQDVGINRLSKDTDKQGYGQGEIVDDYSDEYKDDTKSEWSMAVQTSGVIPILVEAFKELEARIAALEGS